MRTHFFGSLLLCCLIASVQCLPSLPGKSSPKRNTLVDVSPGKLRPSVSPGRETSIYECLYVYPDLPACDFERTEEDSGQDRWRSSAGDPQVPGDPAGSSPKDESTERTGRSISDAARPGESPGRRVIVYTIEGCLPARLPFAMPSCRGGKSTDEILEVRKLYPFTVKGVTKAPLIFPKFDFDRWSRMIKRLRSRATNSKRNENTGGNRSGMAEEFLIGIASETSNATGRVPEGSGRSSDAGNDNKLSGVDDVKNNKSLLDEETATGERDSRVSLGTSFDLVRSLGQGSALNLRKGMAGKGDTAWRKKPGYARKVLEGGQTRRASGKHEDTGRSFFVGEKNTGAVGVVQENERDQTGGYPGTIRGSRFQEVPNIVAQEQPAFRDGNELPNVSEEFLPRNRRSAIGEEGAAGLTRNLLEVFPARSNNLHGERMKFLSQVITDNGATRVSEDVSTTPGPMPWLGSVNEPGTKKKHAKLTRKQEKLPGKQ